MVTRTEPPGDPARHRLVVSAPALWPAWPFLPLVRRSGDTEELGVLFDALGACGLTGYGSAVFLCNVFALPARLDQLLALPKEVFDTADELIQSGWRVD
jgi:hypothetical protein